MNHDDDDDDTNTPPEGAGVSFGFFGGPGQGDMNFDLQEAAERLDGMVEFLTHQDWMMRKAVAEDDRDGAAEASAAVGRVMNVLGWAVVPTVIMHFACHVNVARREAFNAAQACGKAGEMLHRVVVEFANQVDNPILLAELLDMAKMMVEMGEEVSFKPAEEGQE
jgi:hypothetical protein